MVVDPYAVAVTKERSRLAVGGRLWVVASVFYGVFRVIFAGAFIADYGLNIYAYALVELTSSLTLGLSTAHLAKRVMARRSERRALLITAAVASYFAPDAYLLAFAHRMPARLRIPVLLVVAVGAVSGVVRFRRFRSGETSES